MFSSIIYVVSALPGTSGVGTPRRKASGIPIISSSRQSKALPTTGCGDGHRSYLLGLTLEVFFGFYLPGVFLASYILHGM